ncbi:MAG: hypothetical protein GW772_07140 [Flavobacteriia bacterium]|nr:hypothetical protein [Flavobacteriia bacterium]OIP47841.1 MAG: hypothetical protein AUK46_03375 [Flavobacteriaceae bacterium CG2_30_31_66]PIV97206.1 MAG: hypothetical protein COW43_04065 [Flavobacteriaceae bacterium CG17_big_fil_post_rev_8_21_14_2_50_31_13]PIX15214.1 MAG: hypothetical protein COZ74_00850 [Flavobacteriaceae bacterium CG_4_8_14_3_um_filter_31_8]PIY15880.1 MAG: hypothetical protein COZ16_02355 [Flavobacteriaceae bacterium CG_4_10_14_3_um_filter_31_253]PIZ12275.1 MAG: hypotheti
MVKTLNQKKFKKIKKLTFILILFIAGISISANDIQSSQEVRTCEEYAIDAAVAELKYYGWTYDGQANELYNEYLGYCNEVGSNNVLMPIFI